MICSECKKNPAIIFYEKIENGQNTMEGLCYDCAKSKGINVSEVLSKQHDLLAKDNKANLNEMNNQLESLFKNFAENLDLDNIENIDGAITFGSIPGDEDSDYDENERPRFAGAAIPLGSIFSNMFQQNSQDGQNNEKKKNSL